MDNEVTISEEEYELLLDNTMFLDTLFAAGVDNMKTHKSFMKK